MLVFFPWFWQQKVSQSDTFGSDDHTTLTQSENLVLAAHIHDDAFLYFLSYPNPRFCFSLFYWHFKYSQIYCTIYEY